ncbi:uracil-DNA glycosylase family protein [Paraburkholderia sp. RL17-347-BIC-D]|uniref:uracil-DNA glycosylase family protein n=1 Tax=Paraburkholderia sp. RL17-347-BIC-D TaxID=3031632 RepID=UPI0038B6F590
MIEFDVGPPAAFAQLFAVCPDLGGARKHFWYDWGPIFYRGRLDGSAKVLCVASDPGPTERIAGRTLVGDAGQRVQGFLAKLGITRSYLCLNAFAYALIPSESASGEAVLTEAAQLAWRNILYDLSHGPDLQAIIAFGVQAQQAVNLWPGRSTTPVAQVPHPTSHDEANLLKQWNKAIQHLHSIVTPDADGDATATNYGQQFLESDYAPIPRRDLPFGAPTFLGDDAWARASSPPIRSSVSRPAHDDRHTLVWIAPKS